MGMDLAPFVGDEKVQAKFWARVDKLGPQDCWPWRGSKLDKANRGIFYVSKTNVVAARFALATECLPADWSLLACHSCDNAECVNPAHLRWGTYDDNKRDCMERGRVHRWHGSRAGAANQQAKLTNDQARAIQQADGWPESAWHLTEKFSVSIHAVRDVRYGRTFKNVE